MMNLLLWGFLVRYKDDFSCWWSNNCLGPIGSHERTQRIHTYPTAETFGGSTAVYFVGGDFTRLDGDLIRVIRA